MADDRPVAKKVAWAVLLVAQGSELGFTATKAAIRREVGTLKVCWPRGGNQVTCKGHRQKASESRACGLVEGDALRYVCEAALGAGSSGVTPGSWSEGPLASPP